MIRRVRRAFALGLLLLLPAGSPADAQTAPAVQLSDVTVATQPDAVTVFVKTSAPARYEADLIDTPNRLVIDFQDTAYGWRKTPLSVQAGPLRQIRGSQYRKGVARLVVELNQKIGYAIREDDGGLAIVIPSAAPGAAAKPAPKTLAMAVSATPPPAPSRVADAKPAEPKIEATVTAPTAEQTAAGTNVDEPRPTPKVAPKAPVVRVAQAPSPRPPVPPVSAPQTTAPAPPAPSADGARLISLDFKDADVINLLRILAAESGRNIVIGDDVKGKMSISLRNVPWDLALDTIMEARGLVKTERDNVIRIVSAEQLAKEREAKARVEEAKVKAETDIRTKVAEAQLKEQEAAARKYAADVAAAEAAARGPLREETIRLSYADPEDVARTLQGILGIPESGMPAAPPVAPPVIPAPPFSQLFGPDAGKPAAVPVAVPSADVLAKGITIRAHKPTNSIFIRHYANDVERIKKLIRENLDIPLPQVKIEARMEILAREDLFALGVSWGGGGVLEQNSQATLVGRGFTSNQIPGGIPPVGLGSNLANPNANLSTAIPANASTGLGNGGNVVNLPIGTIASAVGSTLTGGAGGLAFGLITSRLNLNLALEALKTQGKTRTLARPEIVTVENAKATMSLGEEIPYATVSSAGTVIQFKEALLKLEVTPTVVREGDTNRIKMKVIVENNSRSATTVDLGSSGNPPVITKRKAETEVLIKEGERLVIGGVTNSENSEATRGVPLFMDMPVFGWLFKQNGDRQTGTELVVFITPTILRRDAPRAALQTGTASK